MGVTRLKRKALRNKAKSRKRNKRIKKLTKQPPIKQVDVEALKAQFGEQKSKPSTKEDQPDSTSDDSSSSASSETVEVKGEVKTEAEVQEKENEEKKRSEEEK